MRFILRETGSTFPRRDQPLQLGGLAVDALTIIGTFMLGAGVGSLLTYVQHRVLIARYRKLVEDLAANSATPENLATNGSAGD